MRAQQLDWHLRFVDMELHWKPLYNDMQGSEESMVGGLPQLHAMKGVSSII